jgi:hypothetical protein
MRKSVISYFCAGVISLLAIAPQIDYHIYVMVNSFHWLYMVIVAVFLGFYLCTRKVPMLIKLIVTYIMLTCFISEVPYVSFNAYVLVVAAIYMYLLLQECNFDIIIGALEAVFWTQLLFATLRYLGMETLMSFGDKEKIFWGTIFQHMRFSSLLCLLAPFLLVRTKWYLVPLSFAVVMTQGNGFALALGAGALIWTILSFRQCVYKEGRILMFILIGLVLLAGAVTVYLGRDSWRVAFAEGRVPVWGVIAKSWCFDTHINFHGFGSPLNPAVQTGPFSWKLYFFGHGLDTFLPLFPYYKYDPYPFPQAHNSWLQYLWELGLIGFVLIAWYGVNLVKRLLNNGRAIETAGCVIIATIMLFHFPDRMTQTMGLMIAYIAMCESFLSGSCPVEDAHAYE